MGTTRTTTTAPVQLARVHDVAVALAVSDNKVYEMAADGTIPCIHVGKRSIRFDLAEVLSILRAGGSDA